MQNVQSLEDFIKTYLENQSIKNTKESYESWVKTGGIDSKGIYNDRLIDANTDYMKSKTGYGSIAESLSKRGLTGSGYSDYIAASAYTDYQKSKDRAAAEYSENERKNLKGYSDYVKGIEKNESELAKDYIGYLVDLSKGSSDTSFMDTITNIGKQSITDYDTAYKIAIQSGLSEEVAASVAEIGTTIVKNGIKTKIMDRVVEFTMTEAEAREYALSLGLSIEDADEIAEYAKNINDRIYTGGYR